MKKKIAFIISVTLVVSLLLAGCGKTEEEKAAEEAFDKQVAQIEKILEEKDADIEAAEKIADDKRPALEEKIRKSLQDQISSVKALEFEEPDLPDTVKDIDAATKKLTKEKEGYKKQINKMNTLASSLDKSMQKYELVKAPKEAYVIKCLKRIKLIDGIAAATEEHDPNGNLNKQGGYTAQVYFSCPLADHTYLDSNIIDAGTEGGGSIEVYKTAKEAKTRDDYLAGFDGGILASGSHKVVGTCLIRTSDTLTATQQKKLENAIIRELTRLNQ